ncbi:histidine kinase [bacterium 336/3]|nr:histidine kinase [bacterium 336/3]
MTEKDKTVQHFLDLIKKSKRGKFKIYIGMSAGVGKTYRMLQEAHSLLKNGIDVKIGYIETHNRVETHALLTGIPIIPRKKMFYKGKELDEMDLQAVLQSRPEVVIVDELAHTNIEGSKNEKRWQDVIDILEMGINVISAINIQHIESLNEQVKQITGIEVKERVPDNIIAQADEVVNIDLTADELILRLKEGKIYHPDKVQTALSNFFQKDHILQLRELALKEVASQVERKVETEIHPEKAFKHERFLACISTNEKSSKYILRKTARLASYYNAKWYALYVQTAKESPDKINLADQRHLIHSFNLVLELGGELIKVKNDDIADAILEVVEQQKITTICMGKPTFSWWKILVGRNLFIQLSNKLSPFQVDLIILSQ